MIYLKIQENIQLFSDNKDCSILCISEESFRNNFLTLLKSALRKNFYFIFNKDIKEIDMSKLEKAGLLIWERGFAVSPRLKNQINEDFLKKIEIFFK